MNSAFQILQHSGELQKTREFFIVTFDRRDEFSKIVVIGMFINRENYNMISEDFAPHDSDPLEMPDVRICTSFGERMSLVIILTVILLGIKQKFLMIALLALLPILYLFSRGSVISREYQILFESFVQEENEVKELRREIKESKENNKKLQQELKKIKESKEKDSTDAN